MEPVGSEDNTTAIKINSNPVLQETVFISSPISNRLSVSLKPPASKKGASKLSGVYGTIRRPGPREDQSHQHTHATLRKPPKHEQNVSTKLSDFDTGNKTNTTTNDDNNTNNNSNSRNPLGTTPATKKLNRPPLLANVNPRFITSLADFGERRSSERRNNNNTYDVFSDDFKPKPRRSQSELSISSWDLGFDYLSGFNEEEGNSARSSLVTSASAPIVSKTLNLDSRDRSVSLDINQLIESGPLTERSRSPSTSSDSIPHPHDSGIRKSEEEDLVNAGTVDSLVALLTDITSVTGTQFVEHFLFTYRYFMNSIDLLSRLENQFLHPNVHFETPNAQQVTRLKVINVLKKWVDNHWYDFVRNDENDKKVGNSSTASSTNNSDNNSDNNSNSNNNIDNNNAYIFGGALLKRFSSFVDDVVKKENPRWGDYLEKLVKSLVIKSVSTGNSSESALKQILPHLHTITRTQSLPSQVNQNPVNSLNPANPINPLSSSSPRKHYSPNSSPHGSPSVSSPVSISNSLSSSSPALLQVSEPQILPSPNLPKFGQGQAQSENTPTTTSSSSSNSFLRLSQISSMNNHNNTNTTPLEILAALIRASNIVKDRKKGLRTVKNAVLGNELIDWMVVNIFSDPLYTYKGNPREESLKIAELMLKEGLFRKASENTIGAKNRGLKMKDKPTMYYFPQSSEEEASLPPSILPKSINPQDLSFVDCHPVEVARQLTLIEQDYYQLVTPDELTHQAWNKPEAKTRAPHLSALIGRFNEVSYWVATEIVLTPNLKERVSVLKRFIAIAEECHKLRNWNTLFEILIGLNLGSVQRLKKTWAALPRQAMDSFTSLSELTSPSQNYVKYRKATFNIPLPSLPYISVYLRDLTFIEDGNKDCIEQSTPTGEELMINFQKMRMLAKIFEDIQRFQKVTYKFRVVPPIRQYITSPFTITVDKDLYKRSHACEPPERSYGSQANPPSINRRSTSIWGLALFKPGE